MRRGLVAPSLVGVCLLVSALAPISCGRDGGAITVYAAASLTDALTEAAKVYGDSTGIPVVTRFGASGMLATVIEEGAPADLFISADLDWLSRLESTGLLAPGTGRVIATNRLVVVVPRADSSDAPRDPTRLLDLERVAIGDPKTVPAGRYASQALDRAGVWKSLEPRMVFTADVRGALALAERGEVDAAVVYATDAPASEKVVVAFVFPVGSHEPIAYPGALLTHSPHPEKARDFLDFLSRSRGQQILRAHGFGN